MGKLKVWFLKVLNIGFHMQACVLGITPAPKDMIPFSDLLRNEDKVVHRYTCNKTTYKHNESKSEI